jgi:hypothetical protein
MTNKQPPLTDTPPRPLLIHGKPYRVVGNHQFFASRVGIFQFMGGPKKDIVILAKPDQEPLEPLVLFCVGVNDILTGL